MCNFTPFLCSVHECMHAIKTIAELQELCTFSELDLHAQGQAHRSNLLNKHLN